MKEIETGLFYSLPSFPVLFLDVLTFLIGTIGNNDEDGGAGLSRNFFVTTFKLSEVII